MRFRVSCVVALGVCAMAAGVWCVPGASAQSSAPAAGDPVSVSPEHFRPMIDNDYVRVLDVRHQPGESDKMHQHPTSAYFVLSGDKMRFHLERSQRDGDVRAGSVTLQGPIATHSVENIGESLLHFVMVERTGGRVARVDGEDAVEVSGSIYRVVDENDDFRVLDVTLEPGQKDEVHSHQASVIYALSPASGTWHEMGQEPRTQVFRPGSAIFFDATESISLENTGQRNIRLIIFEILR